MAFGIITTWPWTWVSTMFVYTCFIWRTFRINNTLWSTIWRASNILRKATTRWDPLVVTALWIWATWWWYTWIDVFSRWILWWWCWKSVLCQYHNVVIIIRTFILTWYLETMSKWISSEFWSTSTNWIVIYYFTISILSTNTNAWVRTLLIDTCFITVAFWTHYTFWSTSRRTSNKCW